MLKISRRGHIVRPPGRWRTALNRVSATCSDVTQTSLVALKESADAFPPLKSAAGGVLAVWNLANRAKTSKKKAKATADRCDQILQVLADAVPDPFNITPEMQENIHKFTILLQEICYAMQRLQRQTRISMFLHLNRNEDKLDGFRQRLDEAYQNFAVAAALRSEVKLLEIQNDIANTSAKIELLDHGVFYISSLLTVSIGLF